MFKNNVQVEIDENLSLEELKDMVNKSIEKCNAEETLLLNINHDLRGHLNVIISTLQYIEKIANADNNLNKYLNIAKRSCYKMLKLINNLIDTTKLQNNCYTLQKRNVDIIPMIENTVDEIEKYAKEKEISLVFDTNMEECIVSIDPEAIDRVVMNLLSNAIKFSNKNTTIVVNVLVGDKNITISVKDEGIGISEDDKNKIFDRFYQGSIRENKEYIGSGIGLDLTNYLIKAHNGNIDVKSGEGKGSEFIVTLPLIVEEGIGEIQEKEISSKIQMLELEFSDIYLS